MTAQFFDKCAGVVWLDFVKLIWNLVNTMLFAEC